MGILLLFLLEVQISQFSTEFPKAFLVIYEVI